MDRQHEHTLSHKGEQLLKVAWGGRGKVTVPSCSLQSSLIFVLENYQAHKCHDATHNTDFSSTVLFNLLY